MKKMLYSIKKKISSKKGESIAEVLIAMLIVALGAILLASMVIGSRNLITKSEEAYTEQMTEKNVLEDMSGNSSSGNVSIQLVTKNIMSDGTDCSLSSNFSERVKYYSSSNDSSKTGKYAFYEPLE